MLSLKAVFDESYEASGTLVVCREFEAIIARERDIVMFLLQGFLQQDNIKVLRFDGGCEDGMFGF